MDEICSLCPLRRMWSRNRTISSALGLVCISFFYLVFGVVRERRFHFLFPAPSSPCLRATSASLLPPSSLFLVPSLLPSWSSLLPFVLFSTKSGFAALVWVLKRVFVKRVGGENRGLFWNSSYLLRKECTIRVKV